MKYLLIILSISILLSAEMEVDGDLKVTGTVESTTIDSLKAVIADLQAQLAAMQGNVKSRSYTLTLSNQELINFENITGISLDWYRVEIVQVTNAGDWDQVKIEGIGGHCMVRQMYGYPYMAYPDNNPLLAVNTNSDYTVQITSNSNTATITLLITAQFPN